MVVSYPVVLFYILIIIVMTFALIFPLNFVYLLIISIDWIDPLQKTVSLLMLHVCRVDIHSRFHYGESRCYKNCFTSRVFYRCVVLARYRLLFFFPTLHLRLNSYRHFIAAAHSTYIPWTVTPTSFFFRDSWKRTSLTTVSN